MSDLIGRSRNERKLDGIYNKQRGVLVNKRKEKTREDLYIQLSKRKVNEIVPFPEIYQPKKKIKGRTTERRKEQTLEKENEKEEYEKKNVKDEKEKSSNQGTDLYKAIYDIINRHILSKQKFFKSVNIFINLCIHYLNNENKKVFFYAFDQITSIFTEKYLCDELKKTNNLFTFYNCDELHVKSMISLFDKVINQIVQNQFRIMQSKEEQTSKEIQELKGETELSEKERNDETKEEELKNRNQKVKKVLEINKQEKQFLKMLKIKTYYLVILFKLNDNFIFNKLIVIYKEIFEEIQKEYNMYEEIIQEKRKEELESEPEHLKVNEENEHVQNYELYFETKWHLPDDFEIFQMKTKAFVRCLSKLYDFINIPWAKTSVENLFYQVYIKKHIFEKDHEMVIEKLQLSIKSKINKTKTKEDTHTVLSIGETVNPVVDARSEKIVSLHGSHIWSNKQM